MARPLHVLQIIAQLDPGGGERQLLRFVQTFDPGRIRCSLITWHVTDPLVQSALAEAGCPVYVLDRHRGRGSGFVLDLLRTGWRVRPDVVHGWLMAGMYWGMPLAKWFLQRPIVVSVRSTPLGWPEWVRIAHVLLWRRCNWLLINSARNRQALIRRCFVNPRQVEVQYNGIDLARFQPADPAALRSATRSALGLTDEDQVVSIVGRLRPEKNHLLLFGAAEALGQEFPRLRVLVVGEGDEEPRLQEWVRQHRLEQRVQFLGRREDVPALLAAADLHVLCSNHEGMPNAVLEAMAAGRPVISTDVGGVPEIVRPGIDGLLIRPGDQVALTSAIGQLLRQPAQAAAMARQAREQIGQSWDIAQVTEHLTQVYERLAGRR